jgi:predicted DNA-binding transcriptional regulator YafY
MTKVLDTSTRLLRLLTLLESRRDWSGVELADRLEVSTRTVRHDMARIRSLGYPVEASPGVAGGYRLGSGGALPPLLLDDDEAVAVAVGLRTAAGRGVAGMAESAVRALVKLEQVLPVRLRHRVSALQDYTVDAAVADEGVDPQLLVRIAAACRDSEVLWVDYLKHDGTGSSRALEPHRLVHWGRRWYLVAWDRGRSGWRTFRVDRLHLGRGHGPRFTPRELPAEDLAAYVRGGIRSAIGRVEALVKVHAPAEGIIKRVPPDVVVEPLDNNTCLVHAYASSPELLAIRLGMLDADFEVNGPPELIACVKRLASRYASASTKKDGV